MQKLFDECSSEGEAELLKSKLLLDLSKVKSALTNLTQRFPSDNVSRSQLAKCATTERRIIEMKERNCREREERVRMEEEKRLRREQQERERQELERAQHIEKIVQQVAVQEKVVEDEQPFVRVEQMPSFQGGDLMTFRNWVQSKVRYPQIAQENGISGRVLMSFIIEKDGSLTNIKVRQTPDRSLSDEAVRVLKQSPKWKPGKQRNQTVRVEYTMPVDFRIQN